MARLEELQMDARTFKLSNLSPGKKNAQMCYVCERDGNFLEASSYSGSVSLT
jgi:hypothetical protein